MLVTTKGRYAMRLMIRIAQQGPDGKVPLRKVAEEEDISLKYLEQVVRPLMAAGLVRSVRGKGGGYALAREASEIREDVVIGCPRKGECSTVRFWAGLVQLIVEYVDSATLADFLEYAPEPGMAIEGC